MYAHRNLATIMANAIKLTAQISFAIAFRNGFRVTNVKLKIAAARVITVVILVHASKPIESRCANVHQVNGIHVFYLLLIE